MSGLIPVKVGLDFVYLQLGVIFLFSPTDRNHRTSCDISNWSDQMPLSWRWITLELGMYVRTYIHININSLQWCGRKVQWHHWCFIGTLEGWLKKHEGWLKKHVMFSAACTQEGQHAGRCVEALGSSRFLQHISIFLCLSASSHPICSLRTWEKRSTFGLFTEWRAQSEIVSKKLGWCYICENTIRKKEEKKKSKKTHCGQKLFFPQPKSIFECIQTINNNWKS